MKLFRNSIPELLSTVSALGLAALGFFKEEIENSIFDEYLLWLFALFFILAFIAIFLSVRRSKTQKDNAILAKENRALRSVVEDGNRNYFDVWDDKSRTIFQSLNLNIKCRLSIYKFDEVENMFSLLGRYAENPSYRARGRAKYPSNEGVIGQAWEDGECDCKKMPNYTTSPDKYFEESQKKYGIPRKTIERMAMKSRSIYAKNIRDTNGTPIAVVVIESIRREAFNAVNLKQKFEENQDQVISEMIESLKFMEPSLKVAKELGL